jgi:hypothetical protein
MWIEKDPTSYSSVAVLSCWQISEVTNNEATYTTLLNHNCTKRQSTAFLKTLIGTWIPVLQILNSQ